MDNFTDYKKLITKIRHLTTEKNNCPAEKQAGVSKLLEALEKQMDDLHANWLEAKQKHKAEHKELNTVIQSIPDCVWTLKLQNDHLQSIFFSKAVERITGYPAAYFQQLSNWLRITHPSDIVKVRNFYNTTLSGRHTNSELEFRIITAEGRKCWLRVSVATTYDENNTRIDGVLSDISEYKKAIEQLQQLFVSVEQSPTAIVITDIDGNIEYVNPTFSTLTGYSADEVLGHNPRILKSKEHDDSLYAGMWQTIASGKIWQGEIINKRKSGELYWENQLISPVTNEQGTITHYIAIKEDISKRKEAEKKLRQSEKKLKELNATKDKLFSILAHDLKNPFHTIFGFSEMLIKNISRYPQEKVIRFLEYQAKSAQEGYNLLENLLEWSRSQTGRLKWQPTTFDLWSIAQNSVNLLSATAKKKKINLINAISQGTLVYADSNMLTTVVRNLMSNALKFTNEGGSVMILSKNNDLYVEVQVKDTGIGIASEHLSKLFDLENTASRRGTAQERGSGLGLVLCKEFVEYNNGTISVKSEVGKGSTFTFTIPKNSHTTTKQQDDKKLKTSI